MGKDTKLGMGVGIEVSFEPNFEELYHLNTFWKPQYNTEQQLREKFEVPAGSATKLLHRQPLEQTLESLSMTFMADGKRQK